MLFGYAIYYVSAMLSNPKNTAFCSVLGNKFHSECKSQQTTPQKYTLGDKDGHLEALSVIFGSPLGSPLGGEILSKS